MLCVGSCFSDEVHCIVMCVHRHPNSVHCSLFLSFDSHSTPFLSLRFEVLAELNVKLWSYSVFKRALKMEAVGYTSTISCDQSGCAMSGHVILQPVCLSPVSHFGSPVSIPGQSAWDVVDKVAQGQNFVKLNCFPAYYHVVIARYLYFSSTIDITLVTRLHATWCRVEQASCQEREHCTGTSRTFSVCFKHFNSDWSYKCFERSITLPGHSEVNLAAAMYNVRGLCCQVAWSLL